MNTSLHTVRALLVSSSEAQTQRISALLTRARIVPFDHAGSARTVCSDVFIAVTSNQKLVRKNKKDASDADKGHFPPGHRETSAFSKSYHMNLCLRPQKQHAEFCQSKSMYIIHHGICTCQG